MVAASHSSPIGTLGRYEVVGQLATGGMAEILLARLVGPQGFERPVVLKRILPHLARQPRFRSMLVDEARLVASIRHANVVHVHELGQEGDELFLVMEYLEGESLGGVLRRLAARNDRMTVELAAHVIAEVAAGLHAAHELTGADGKSLGLVHRDVSPQNVFITYSGDVKLLDFGIAKAVNSADRTETGIVRGKFQYMSPEQCLGQTLTRQSDLFSVGVLLYETSTQRRLFKRENQLLTFRAICEEAVVAPSQAVDGYPADLEPVVLRAIARQPADRYATAAELRADLLRFLRPRLDGDPRDELSRLMSDLFPDRRAEKRTMLEAVRAGEKTVNIVEGEVDEQVEIPLATDFGSQLMSVQRPARRLRLPLALLLVLVAAGASLVLVRPESPRLMQSLALPARLPAIAASGAATAPASPAPSSARGEIVERRPAPAARAAARAPAKSVPSADPKSTKPAQPAIPPENFERFE